MYKYAGKRRSTTLTIDPGNGSNPGANFSSLEVMVNNKMGKGNFELNEIQFFTNKSSGNITCIMIYSKVHSQIKCDFANHV